MPVGERAIDLPSRPLNDHLRSVYRAAVRGRVDAAVAPDADLACRETIKQVDPSARRLYRERGQ
jgi:hypothetical protein